MWLLCYVRGQLLIYDQSWICLVASKRVEWTDRIIFVKLHVVKNGSHFRILKPFFLNALSIESSFQLPLKACDFRAQSKNPKSSR